MCRASAGAIARPGGLTGRGPFLIRICVPQRDVKALRKRLGFSQRRFAQLLRLNVDTLRGWEMGRRRPSGAAATLLQILAAEPDTVLRVLLATRPGLAPKRPP